jgi:hypothetical protein
MAKSSYEQHFYSRLKQRNAENRARREAEAATEWLTLPQAVHLVKQYEGIARRGREREAQVEQIERWLSANFVELVKGIKLIRKGALEVVLREIDPQAAAEGQDAGQPPRADAIQAKRARGAKRPKRAAKAAPPKHEQLAALIDKDYPPDQLRPDRKTLATKYAVSTRSITRAFAVLRRQRQVAKPGHDP